MNQLFSFFGRTGRGGFWLGILMSMIFAGVGIGLASLLFGQAFTMPLGADGLPDPTATPTFNANPLFWGVAGVGYLLGFWTQLANAVKRLHDRGKSGWWYLLMLLLSLILIGSIWIIVELGILEGQEGTNKYGSDPRAA